VLLSQCRGCRVGTAARLRTQDSRCCSALGFADRSPPKRRGISRGAPAPLALVDASLPLRGGTSLPSYITSKLHHFQATSLPAHHLHFHHFHHFRRALSTESSG